MMTFKAYNDIDSCYLCLHYLESSFSHTLIEPQRPSFFLKTSVGSCFTAFLLAVSCAWDALPQVLHSSLASFKFQLKYHSPQ